MKDTKGSPPALIQNQVVDMLLAASSLLEVELEALPSQALGWHPEPNEWCIKQVLGHLIETERPGFADRISLMRDSSNPKLVSLDQDEEAVQRRDCERDGLELLAEFITLRKKSCELVATLTDTDLQCRGLHPDVGYITVSDLLHEWVYHDRDHIQQIMTNIQGFVWNHLGATQVFYAA